MATAIDPRGASRSRQAMWALGIVLGAVLAYVIYSYIGTFVLGLFVYYITRPIHRRIAKRLPSSSLAAAVSLITIALPLLLLLGYTVYVGALEIAAFAENQDLTVVTDALEPYVGDLGGAGGDPQQLVTSAIQDPQGLATGSASGTVQAAATSVLAYLGVLGNALIHLFIVLALGFYLLRDDHRFAGWFRTQLAGEDTPAYAYFATVDHDLKTVFFGNILNAFAVAILGSISYTALNLFAPQGMVIPSPVLVGLLVGVGSLVPVVGMKIVYVPLGIVLAVDAALTSPSLLWFPGAFFAVSLLVVDTIPDLMLRPYVSGRDMHTGSVMIAYIVGPLLFGWYGLFLGPLLLVAIVHFARIVLPELARGEPLTTRSSAESPLDPARREAPADEPESVSTREDTELEPEPEAGPGAEKSTDDRDGDAGRDEPSDRGRSSSSATNGGTPTRDRSPDGSSNATDDGSTDEQR